MLQASKFKHFYSGIDIRHAGRMARTKMSVQKSRLPINPFSRINAHGAQLLDVNRIQGLCQATGKNA